ncbi:hypothetical protein A2210_02225 [Candidatus Woesebacteria bacterium RIFOXYA1_FULL_40_18]|uniref:Uncharacterized protein n=4 Tax=Candidatus Woeseibacteriota TaxID=1752722 RepID=A0A1F8CIZ4_9BACT|nr:MAG: hypothetical protein UT72_C0020G0003 [Candidatus Woesebacteria bacterium GW2011_GWB1_40_101]OGM76242.1 MAG: hypothetical protein A2210_02225 [Candidatus Woesebacteria bacterium RIFOXYA1_FULL_40_18]OGM80552.1 MAG: hypothetical protein A2361_00440 [Candidatus Woesebacteria bacterium RIFOXYB1_FULL_40_26]OGM87589.1 MAG: hypothetical protein A2614_02335 [Candidatus Woesebacteria bacterium RIFOXYD1_FULL_40_21]
MNLAKLLAIIFVIISISFGVYLVLPQPFFPSPAWDFVSSTEPADRETPLRRGYFTNLTREQLMSHYKSEFGWGLTLNYPPEEAQTLVRDQTKSSFLEEIVHPFKESLFVNGYEPKGNDITGFMIDGKIYKQKVIVKYVPSNIFLRVGVGIFTLVCIWILTREWIQALKSTFQL